MNQPSRGTEMSVRPVMEIVIGSGLSCDSSQWETEIEIDVGAH